MKRESSTLTPKGDSISAIGEHATQHARYNLLYVWAVSLAAALGGLMFGYDWIVISGTKPFYERFFDLQTASQEGWAMGSALIGCLLGAVLSGSLSDKFGRKRLLILSALVFVVSSIGTALVGSFFAFNLWRMAGGVAIGLASNLSPIYIAEVAPAAVRGRLVSMNQFTIVIGILLAQAVNYFIAGHGTNLDRQAIANLAGQRAVALDSRQVAKELSWQLPRKSRDALLREFTRLADQRPEPLDQPAAADLVAVWNAQHPEDKLKADATAVETAGLGLTASNVSDGWRWMFGVTAVPACFFFLAVLLVPESPRWLVRNRKSQAARGVLARIGGDHYAQQELANIEQTVAGEIARVNFSDLLEPRVQNILVLGVTLAVLQQWCGINVIFYYAADLFQAAGYSVPDALLNIVIIGAVNLVFTVLAVSSVDRFGRRILMLIGFAGLTMIHTLIGLSYFCQSQGIHILLLTLAAIGCYALSLAPVTWVVLSEIFPNRIRGAAMSVSVVALWTACFILTYSFSHLKESLSIAKTFWIYAAICLGGLLFTWYRLPETKAKTLEELEQELTR